MKFFTADEHYWHKNIMEYQGRTFDTIEEHNEKLIENHNSVVTVNDTTYHVGDMCFGRFDKWCDIVTRLNGKHVLIIGSHDKVDQEIATLFQTVESVMEIREREFIIFMSHYAHRRWPKSHYGSFHLYGHTHGNLEGFGRSMDVGVDTEIFEPGEFNGQHSGIQPVCVHKKFFPYSMTEIVQLLNKPTTDYKIYEGKRR